MAKISEGQYRQGDVLLVRVAEASTGAEVPRDKGRVVLAYGEVTGHAHALVSADVALFEPSDAEALAAGQRILRVHATAVLAHEEHSHITVPAGTYRVVRQREYAPEENRNVAD